MEDMRSVAEVMENNPVGAVSILYSLLMTMDKDFVLPTICTALDQWFADNGFTEEEALETYEWMAQTARECYKEMGMSPKLNNAREA